MSYIKIEDLSWDTLPGGTLVSTVILPDVENCSQNPDDEANPLHGPALVEYRLVEGQLEVTLAPSTPTVA